MASAPPSSWEVEEWRRVAMVILIPLPDEIRDGGHAPCPSSHEKWKSEVMATPILLLNGRRKGGDCQSPPLLLRTGGAEECGDDHPVPL